MESFKKSKLSICHDCCNFSERCDIRTTKTCGTDSRERVAYVQKCGDFNKPFPPDTYTQTVYPLVVEEGECSIGAPEKHLNDADSPKDELNDTVKENLKES